MASVRLQEKGAARCVQAVQSPCVCVCVCARVSADTSHVVNRAAQVAGVLPPLTLALRAGVSVRVVPITQGTGQLRLLIRPDARQAAGRRAPADM